MKETFLTVIPRDPLVIRDGRPFGQGGRMKTLPWIYPSVFVGSLRTMLGKRAGVCFDEAAVTALKEVRVRGPFPQYHGVLFFPKPLDCVVGATASERNGTESGKRTAWRLCPTPLGEGEGCNIPPGLLPVLAASSGGLGRFKPVTTAPFWSLTRMTDWLADASFEKGTERELPQIAENPDSSDALVSMTAEQRVHVAMDSATGTAIKGRLHSTVGLDLNRDGADSVELFAEAAFDETMFHVDHFAEYHPLGGRRRLAFWRFATAVPSPLAPPKKILDRLRGAEYLRMVLATPALFRNGYLPGWLDEQLTGRPVGAPEGIKLRLTGLVTDRWLPISGWSYEKTGGKTPGPKPVRRLVPPGSVYYFHVESGDAAEWVRQFWLRPVNDDAQDNRDGFGMALWGRG